ncbi:receptor-type tyrosine-protein phosphatase mu-like isoform X1 [Tachysurus ichikawai]
MQGVGLGGMGFIGGKSKKELPVKDTELWCLAVREISVQNVECECDFRLCGCEKAGTLEPPELWNTEGRKETSLSLPAAQLCLRAALSDHAWPHAGALSHTSEAQIHSNCTVSGCTNGDGSDIIMRWKFFMSVMEERAGKRSELRVSARSHPSSFNGDCNFERPYSECGYSQGKDDDFDWEQVNTKLRPSTDPWIPAGQLNLAVTAHTTIAFSTVFVGLCTFSGPKDISV